MPRKVFVAGEILTAADVNTNLMDQAVMVFDDSTARGSAIPSPSEGMVTYLKDTDTLEKYTTAWVPAGGLVETKTALKTDTFSASVASGANVAVTDLSITHEVQNASNKLIISAFFGAAASSNQLGDVAIGIDDGGGLINVGAAASSRTSVSAGGQVSNQTASYVTTMPSIFFVYTPGAGSKTYTVRAININASTRTLYVNRRESDTDAAGTPRAVSAITIMEVAV